MLFNSLVFFLYFPVVFAAYWLLGRQRVRLQNAFLIVASYIFYGWWDWRFLGLIILSSLVDFVVGWALDSTDRPGRRRLLFGISLLVNLGALGFFKYMGFFVDSFAALLEAVGMQANLPSLRILLPVGISFYTFQTMSYTIDIYRRKTRHTRDPIAFFAFVAFFPQLVAGPIERATTFLPQFQKPRSVELPQLKDDMRRILWGFVKKVLIADNIAPHVDQIFANNGSLDGVTLLAGSFLFAIQIYGDFSGYSDIAIGTGGLLGFRLRQNFAYPYFSRDIAEFWRRWHISLSTWFRDYVYIPLGGSYVKTRSRRIFNILVTFTVSGFWHGANWTFLAWGFLNGTYYLPLMLVDRHKEHTDVIAEHRWYPSAGEFGKLLLTFAATLVAWVFFRAESIGHAVSYLTRMVSRPYLGLGYVDLLEPVLLGMGLLVWEWWFRREPHGLQVARVPVVLRWTIYLLLLFALLLHGNFGSSQFIYFQF